MLPPVSHASATKISSTSPRAAPLRCPRATASVFPLGPCFGYETYTSWLSANFGCTATKCSESPAVPAGVGDVHTGCGASTPLRIIRRAPFFSVTRIVLASANAMPHGWNSPLATVTTRILPPCTSRICGLVSRGGAACCAHTGRASRTAATVDHAVLGKCFVMMPRCR
jgi:hypothetical protein